MDNEFNEVSNEAVGGRSFIVLAATSRQAMKAYLGRAFYPVEVGLAGWVFESGNALNLEDSSNPEELRMIDPALKWEDRYGGSEEYYHAADRKAILVEPILAQGRPIGVLKIHSTLSKKPFGSEAPAIVRAAATVIGNSVSQTRIVHEQRRTMLGLAEMATEQTLVLCWTKLWGVWGRCLEFRQCRLYILDSKGRCVTLASPSDLAKSPDLAPDERCFCPEEGLVGWVLKTGKPLIISDMHEFVTPQILDSSRLDNISDGSLIRQEDCKLQCKRTEAISHRGDPLPFLAVPVMRLSDRSIQGVLTASSLAERAFKRTIPFSKNDLDLAELFARAVAVVLEHERERRLAELLVRFGYRTELGKLFRLTVQSLGELVFGGSCYIFESNNRRQLELASTNLTADTKPPQTLPKLRYVFGEGKTGLCALAQATFVVNHFGSDELDQRDIDVEKVRITDEHPRDCSRRFY